MKDYVYHRTNFQTDASIFSHIGVMFVVIIVLDVSGVGRDALTVSVTLEEDSDTLLVFLLTIGGETLCRKAVLSTEE